MRTDMEVGALRQMLDEARESSGMTLADLTVLSAPVDPFRLDTPKNHTIGRWLADALAELAVSVPIHLRGMHYVLLEHRKPDGAAYTNTDEDWVWLGSALKAARWLGYVEFGDVIDNRNAAPVIREAPRSEVYPFVSSGVHVDIDPEVHPRVGLADFAGLQPYRLVLIGEKASLDPVLSPVAEAHGADLVLPTGNLSDTLVHTVARSADEDGRPLRVFYFADCDPSGWNMPIEVARKLQAFQALHFPGLEFEVHRVGLTPEQVNTLGLPSTPLKATERRADKWRAATGVEQTEVDALASLRPAVLQELASQALAPFFDTTLSRRSEQVRHEWITAAQRVVDDAAGTPEMQRVQQAAREQLAELEEQVDALNDALRVDPTGLDLPAVPEPPGPELEGKQPKGVVSSLDDFVAQVQGLIDQRNYGGAR